MLNHGEESIEVILPDIVFRSLFSREGVRGNMHIAAHDVIILLEEKDM